MRAAAETTRQQSDQGKETEQHRGGASDGQIRPLPLGFDTQMSSDFLEGHFDLPAHLEPLQDLQGLLVGIRA